MPQLFGLERKSLQAQGNPGCVRLLGAAEGGGMRPATLSDKEAYAAEEMFELSYV